MHTITYSSSTKIYLIDINLCSSAATCVLVGRWSPNLTLRRSPLKLNSWPSLPSKSRDRKRTPTFRWKNPNMMITLIIILKKGLNSQIRISHPTNSALTSRLRAGNSVGRESVKLFQTAYSLTEISLQVTFSKAISVIATSYHQSHH